MSDLISRGVPLDDMSVKGRTVTAYAAVFNSPTEIKDGSGHYLEDISRVAFTKTVREAGARAGYFYNHGMTIHGTPDFMGSIPLGVSRSVKPDSRGLLTVAEIGKHAMGDAVLEAINNGAITGYSFTGAAHKSNPPQLPRFSRSGELPKITRMEIALKEYGPTPFPAYQDASIVAVRSSLLSAHDAVDLSDEDKAGLLYAFLMRFTGYQPKALATSNQEAGTEVPSQKTHTNGIREAIREKMANSGVERWNSEALGGSSSAS